MSGNKDFFRERRAQAVFKHGILSRYPTVFASKTGVADRQVVLLDGYAGRGEYEDGSPGSPLLLARTAKRVQAFRDVTGVYVEKDPDDFANLQQVMAVHGRDTDRLFPEDLRECLPQVLQLAQGAALFAFLDPFGTALDRAQLVGDLLGRRDRAPVEVLLHLSVSTVARLGGLLRRRREQGVQVLDRRMPSQSDTWTGFWAARGGRSTSHRSRAPMTSNGRPASRYISLSCFCRIFVRLRGAGR
ncbi:MAG TPA: three-Cys-motif partner protein TcmP [Pseudonocardiaceae bacterium]|jgi:three-Cys-motif partner protein|nr:three-Cys-motif partner protein TcmP [Pseudonocardiaceae bacterium]